MEQLTLFINKIFELGATAILPIMITILGVFFKMKFDKALKAGLTVGVGFIGLTLIVNLLSTSLEPAIAYYSALGTGYTIVDVGWPAVGAAAWAVPFAALAIPLIMVVNLVMVRFQLTKTMNVDVWNFMHFLIPGALAYFLFDSFALGLIVTLLMSVLALIIADKTAPMWEEYFGLEGTSCTTIMYTGWAMPIAWVTNKLIDFIPGLNKIDWNIEKVNEKIGIFGDPVFIGLVVGLLLGTLTKQGIEGAIPMGMGVAAVMVLMPKVVGVLMEGLAPIGEAAKSFIQSWMGEDADLKIGMDISLGLGDPATITTTVLSIPIIILLALVLPNIQFFPVGLLMSITYISVMNTLVSKGNLFRSVMSTLAFAVITMYLGAYIAPGATVFFQRAGVHSGDGLVTVTEITEIWNIFIYWIHGIIG